MIDKKNIQRYVNNFRRSTSQFLKPGVGVECNIYQAESGGAVLEFTLDQGLQNDDIYNEYSSTISTALSKIEQHAFGGNLDAFVFRGTNVIAEDNRIILIKDDSLSVWSDEAAQHDSALFIPKINRRST